MNGEINLSMALPNPDSTTVDRMATVNLREGPQVGDLTLELKRSAVDYGSAPYLQNADAVRYCRWAGQSADNRKWTYNLEGKQAFPWDGASDVKVRIADDVVNSMVDLTTTSFWRSNAKVGAVSADDLSTASVANSLLDWTVNTQLFNELTREVELISQYVWTYGWGGAHITWDQEIGQREREISMDQIVQMAMQAQPGTITADLPQMILNEGAEDQVAELLMSAFSHLKKGQAIKCVRELREEGECEFPEPVVVKNQPVVAALCPIDELVFPPETTHIQSARVVFRRCYMTEIEILQKVQTDEWDEEWAQSAIATRGRFSNYENYSTLQGLNKNPLIDRANLIEVVYAYQKALDESTGLTGVFCTVFCPQATELYGKFEAIEYSHGQYPFVVWRSEFINRKIIESRGAPDICGSWQFELKTQHDSITDHTSLTTVPPIEVPKNRAGNLRLGPAVQLPVLRSGEIKFMDPPAREPSTAFALMEVVKKEVDNYFGRSTEKVPPVMAQMRQQRIVNNWLHGWTEAFKQVLSLQIQYMPQEEVARVTGSNVALDESTVSYDVTLKFDIRELNTDLMTEKLKAISSIALPLDTTGVIDRTKLVTMILRAIDPHISDSVIMERGPAAQKMFDETNNELALMSLGNPPKLRENDPTAQARLQFATQIVQSNPRYQQQAAQDPLFQENLKKYAENLQFSITQQNNAVVGRLGVSPT
jgi:hypothetical protein